MSITFLAQLYEVDSPVSNLVCLFRSITALSATLASRSAARPDTQTTAATVTALPQTTSFATFILTPLPSVLHPRANRAPFLASCDGRSYVTCREADQAWRPLAKAGGRLVGLLTSEWEGAVRDVDGVEVARQRLAGRIRRAKAGLGEARVAERMKVAIQPGRAPVEQLQDENDSMAFRWAVERPWTELEQL